jgi:hypothetical protein
MYMYMYMCVCIDFITCGYICVYIIVCMYIFTDTNTYMYKCMYVFTYIHMYIHIDTYTYTCITDIRATPENFPPSKEEINEILNFNESVVRTEDVRTEEGINGWKDFDSWYV